MGPCQPMITCQAICTIKQTSQHSGTIDNEVVLLVILASTASAAVLMSVICYLRSVRGRQHRRQREQQSSTGVQVCSQFPPRVCEPGQVNETCSMCFEPFAVGGQLCQLPCQHFYHPECINKWLNVARSCPQCRALVCCREGSGSGSERPPQGSGSGSDLRAAATVEPSTCFPTYTHASLLVVRD